MKNRYLLALAFGVMILAAAGCAGYTLGNNLPEGIESVHIPTFVNECSEPRLEIECTSAAIEEFQKDGSLKVANLEGADTLLEVKIIAYSLIPLRFQKDNAKSTKEYRMLLKASVKFTRLDTKDVILDRIVAGESTFELTGDLSSAKRTALPLAAKDLAHDIVESVVEYW